MHECVYISQPLKQNLEVEASTMMKTVCLRSKGEFLSMYFDKGKALINEPMMI